MVPHTLVLEHVSPATRLLEKRRQMFEVQEALEQQKQEFARKEELFKRREESLRKKDVELQDSLIRFSKFLQENDSKRVRALKKAADEHKIRLEKEAELDQLGVTIESLKSEKDTVLAVLEKNLKYEQYMENVLESANDFQEVTDIIARHTTLAATNEDLKQKLQHTSQLAETTRAELQAYVKSNTDENLNLNNTISGKKKKLEELEQETYSLEAKKNYALQVASQRTLEYGQVGMVIENLFQRCCQCSKIAHANQQEHLAQLVVIGNFVSDLGGVVKDLKLQAKASLHTFGQKTEKMAMTS